MDAADEAARLGRGTYLWIDNLTPEVVPSVWPSIRYHQERNAPH